MLYLGRGGLALFYLGIEFVWAAAVMIFLIPRMWNTGPQLTLFVLWELPLAIIGAIHGYSIAKHRKLGAAFPRYSRWYALIGIWLIFPVAALIIRTLLLQPFNAPSASMEPSVNVGDYFWVSKRAYDGSGPKRGDIIVFRGADGDYVKRIVGVPGDKVQMVSGRLVLNGKPVTRQRIADLMTADEYGIVRSTRQYLETLSSGRSYRTLDLTDNSPQDNTSVFVVPADSYFVLGDNRDNSNDSRFEMGYVARASIIGKVVAKFADRQHKTMIWEPVN
jgi:signal peptidase I